MNIALWILQILLALHTAVGAVWKFSNSEQSIPSLKAMPHGVWMALIGVEFLCVLGLVVPGIYKPAGVLVSVAAGVIALEMVFFSVLHLFSGETQNGPMVYWVVVAALCGFVAYGRWVLKPF